MSGLAIFPLNTVLFPNTPIFLHIFEERYKRMIGTCIREQRPFGVVLIRRGMEAGGELAEPYVVGTTADIIQTQPLDGGRLNLTAIGGERFRLHSLAREKDLYLMGETEPFPWRVHNPGDLHNLAGQMRRQLQNLVNLISAVEEQKIAIDLQRLPDDPVALACIAAAILKIEPARKQTALEIESAEGFIRRILALYSHEQMIAQVEIARGDRDPGHPFSIN